MPPDHLVRYGLEGRLCRWVGTDGHAHSRGTSVVVQEANGCYLGEVLRLLPASSPGETPLVRKEGRIADADDLLRESQNRSRALDLLRRSNELAETLHVPIRFVDALILLEGKAADLFLVELGSGETEALHSRLVKELDLKLTLVNGTRPEPEKSCGSGCGSCSSSSGCGTGGCGKGSCSASVPREEIQAFLSTIQKGS